MFFTLSAGEVIHIGNAITLTVLAIEGDMIRFRLDEPNGASPGAPDVSMGNEQANLKHGRTGWELN
jgi:Global regulator protein family